MKFFPKTYNEEQLANLFKNKDKIQRINIIKNKLGKSKGFAYVDFDNSKNAKIGIDAVNSLPEIEGKKIFIAVSNPPKK